MRETLQKYPVASTSVSGILGAVLLYLANYGIEFVESLPKPGEFIEQFKEVKTLIKDSKNSATLPDIQEFYYKQRIYELTVLIDANIDVAANKSIRARYERDLKLLQYNSGNYNGKN